MKKLISILILLAAFNLTNAQPFTNINAGESGLSVRTNLNNLIDYTNDLGLKIQFSSDLSAWHYPWASGDKYIRYSGDFGVTWSTGYGLEQDQNISGKLTVSQASHGLVVGDWITVSSGTYQKAQADSAVTSDVIGVVDSIVSINSFIYQYSGLYERGSWDVGANYFLSVDTAGAAVDSQAYVIGNVRNYLGTGVDGGLLMNIDIGLIATEDVPDGLYTVTYDSLVSLITAKELIPGAFYTISDFATVHYMIDDDAVWIDPGTSLPEINTGAGEPLTVLAINDSTISNDAKSAKYPYDVIHYDWNPDNWLKDIAFGNDTDIITGWKGVIYWRHYTLNDISAPGDWRTVLNRRWAYSTAPSGFNTVYVGVASVSDSVADASDYEDFLMFEETITDPLEDRVIGLTIAPFRDRSDIDYISPTILPNNVFHVQVGYGFFQIVSARFNKLATGNTFGGYIESIETSGLFYNNIIGDDFYYNDIFGDFRDNYVGQDFNGNTMKGSISLCFIGDGFRENEVFAPMQSVNFAGATHVFGNYSKEIYRRPDGTVKLRYYDNNDDLVISDYND